MLTSFVLFSLTVATAKDAETRTASKGICAFVLHVVGYDTNWRVFCLGPGGGSGGSVEGCFAGGDLGASEAVA